jgi:hypothetical protein
MKCWLCERSLCPGEGRKDVFGDVACPQCDDKIAVTARLLERPDMLNALAAVKRLPPVDGVFIVLEPAEKAEEG